VKATDPETGQSAAEPVAGLIRHSGDHAMADVTLADRTTIHATAGHPFWDATIRAFVNAGDLTVGDQVLTADGSLLSVTGVYLHQQDLTAYNLTITDIHTYYAGNAGVLVHNTGSPCDARFVAGPNGTIDTHSPALQNQLQHVVDSLRNTGKPPAGIMQGKSRKGVVGEWENRRGDLPVQDKGFYTESDVWPGLPRGPERIVGGGGQYWYSPDHYGTFRLIQ
jgi:guanyl-specific ribonuclease Sa